MVLEYFKIFTNGAGNRVRTGTPKGWSLSTLTLLCYPRLCLLFQAVGDVAPALMYSIWHENGGTNRIWTDDFRALQALAIDHSAMVPRHGHYRENTENANLLAEKCPKEVDIIFRIFIKRKSNMKEVDICSTDFRCLDKFHTRCCRIVARLKCVDSWLIAILKKECIIGKLCIFKIVFGRLDVVEFAVLLGSYRGFEDILHDEECIGKTIFYLWRKQAQSYLSLTWRRNIRIFGCSPVFRNRQRKTSTTIDLCSILWGFFSLDTWERTTHEKRQRRQKKNAKHHKF